MGNPGSVDNATRGQLRHHLLGQKLRLRLQGAQPDLRRRGRLVRRIDVQATGSQKDSDDLESLSKPPLQRSEGDEGASDAGERAMDVDASFVADGEASEAIEPGECAFDDPAVAAETLAGFDPASGDARRDAAPPAGTPAAAMIIGLVGMQLSGPAPRPAALAADCRDGIEHLLEGHAVMHVGPGQGERERDTLTVCDEVAFRAGTATIGRVQPGRGTPFFAAMEELSSAARLQSMRLASCKRRSNSQCNRSQTPAACQSRRRRQQVTPEPQPISVGSISQGMPLRSTKRMPVSAARAGIGGRPPFGRGRGGGSKGSRIDQRLSEIWGAGIPLDESN